VRRGAGERVEAGRRERPEAVQQGRLRWRACEEAGWGGVVARQQTGTRIDERVCSATAGGATASADYVQRGRVWLGVLGALMGCPVRSDARRAGECGKGLGAVERTESPGRRAEEEGVCGGLLTRVRHNWRRRSFPAVRDVRRLACVTA
jgi:hypothetical protein